MYKVLIAEPSVGKHSNALEILEKGDCEIIRPDPVVPYVKEEDLLKIVRGVDAILTGSDEITARVIEAADKLKVIAKHGVGVDKIDLEAAARKDIVVALAPCTLWGASRRKGG